MWKDNKLISDMVFQLLLNNITATILGTIQTVNVYSLWIVFNIVPRDCHESNDILIYNQLLNLIY
jgi:hypothetical protein